MQEHEPLQDQSESTDNNKNKISLANSSHPLACIFTFAFKAAAFLIYFIFGNFFSDVNTFIIVVVLSAFDFWTVKNVTGRLLVGLRWGNDFDENGKEIWKFSSHNKEFHPNPVDSSIFWTSQLACSGVWAAFFIMKVLSLSIFWSLLCLINFCLSAVNLLGYYKCKGCKFILSRTQQENVRFQKLNDEQRIKNFLQQQMMHSDCLSQTYNYYLPNKTTEDQCYQSSLTQEEQA